MSSDGVLEGSERKARRLDPLSLYTTSISVLGILLLAWALSGLPSVWPEILIFLALIVISELTTSANIVPEVAFSMSSAVSFAALLLFGPLPGALTAMTGGLASTVVQAIVDKRKGRRKGAPLVQIALFNMSAMGLTTAGAGGVYLLAGGTVGQVALLSNVLPALLAAICAEAINEAIVVLVVSFQTGTSALQIWRQNMSWAVPVSILGMFVGGGGLALGYEIVGVLGLIVFFLPIVLTIYAFNLYVNQTKAQMARLEEIIAERTEDLSKANEELKRLDRVKTKFFSVINHEMRTPLSAVLGYATILRSHACLTAEHMRMLEAIDKSGRRLLDLVNDLLDVFRLEDGRMTIAAQEMDIQSAVGHTLTVIKPLSDEKHIEIRVDIPQTVPLVRGDPKRVVQILTNLLSNAVKYTPDTGQVLVAARRREPGDMLEIKVSDSGIGIPANQLPTIFDSYSRVERAEIQHTIGTGLGLSIAKGLVEAHGGEIWVESIEGEGATFYFTLPALPDSGFAEETENSAVLEQAIDPDRVPIRGG